jgi:hypothetical protein
MNLLLFIVSDIPIPELCKYHSINLDPSLPVLNAMLMVNPRNKDLSWGMTVKWVINISGLAIFARVRPDT